MRRAVESAEKGQKAFLLEMPVVRENLGQPFPPHRLHGNTIRKAVALVRPRMIELQPCAKGISALRNNPNDGTCQ